MRLVIQFHSVIATELAGIVRHNPVKWRARIEVIPIFEASVIHIIVERIQTLAAIQSVFNSDIPIPNIERNLRSRRIMLTVFLPPVLLHGKICRSLHRKVLPTDIFSETEFHKRLKQTVIHYASIFFRIGIMMVFERQACRKPPGKIIMAIAKHIKLLPAI